MKILSLGSLNIDYVYSVDSIVRPGETVSALSREIFSGGKGLNQSVALGRAGAPVHHAGLVGSEKADLLNELAGSGVETSLIKTVDGQTGHAVIQVEKTGQNSIIVFGGTNKQVDSTYIQDVLKGFEAGDYLVLQNEISGVARAIEAAHAKGMHVCFNPSPFTEEILDYPLDKISWLLLNATEAFDMTGQEDPIRALDVLAEKYPKMKVVLTLGSDGAVCMDGSSRYNQAAYSVKAVDTTGAGDTFTGYFIAGVASGKDIQEALDTASAAAALSVTKKGAAASIPYMKDVLNFMAD